MFRFYFHLFFFLLPYGFYAHNALHFTYNIHLALHETTSLM